LPATNSNLRTLQQFGLIFIILLSIAPVVSRVNGAGTQPTTSTVSVNLLVNYGNGTLTWYNNTSVPSNSNFYNVTTLVTNGNIGAAFFASFGSHFVYSINGAGCPASNIFCDQAWGFWLLNGVCWGEAQVGIDQILVSQEAIVAWFLTPVSVFGEFPPTGVNCVNVNIDVKPTSDPPAINPTSQGRIPVAILSSATLNATTIVAPSLTFGHSGTEHSVASCKIEDVNGDGLLDLLCLFETPKANFQTGDNIALLSGRTTNGTRIIGTDSIIVV
jgi:hypothetical protein